MEALIPLIIQLASGALGGNIAGSLLKKFSLGTLGNSLVGILGGGLGGQLLGLLGISTGAGSMDVAGIIGSIASGGVGGGVLMAIIGVIRQAFNK
ncbi:MAG: GlsB/YeaQ/YmgE family stress response membrane protein [Sedimenticola sp.]